MSVIRTTHQWLQPLYNNLDGYVSRPLGSPTSLHGLYGQTGIAQLATGTAGTTGITGMGANTGFAAIWINGGSGAYYTLSDVVVALKNVGILKR